MWGVMRMSRPSRVATRPMCAKPNQGLIAAHPMVELHQASSPPDSPDFWGGHTYCIDPCIATTQSLTRSYCAWNRNHGRLTIHNHFGEAAHQQHVPNV